MYNICLFERQLVLTNDMELTRFYDIHTLILLYWQQKLWHLVPFNILAESGTRTI